MDEYKIKVYTFIDNLEHTIDPVEIYGCDADEEKQKVSNLFKEHGWESDGEIKLIWIPPFLYRSGPSTGKYVWHAKQLNNGTSFLAYKGDFPFISDDWQQTKFEENYFKKMIDGFNDNLNDYENNLNKIDKVDSDLKRILLNGIHADIVSNFNDFLNDFSLDIFHELVMYNNPYKLKINYKPNINLSFKNVAEQTDSLPEGTYDENFVFIYSLIQSLYDNFKFEPYEKRINVVCRAFDFDFFPNYGNQLRKQIEFRNAFQHRQGQLDKKSYNAIGMKVEIKQEDGTLKEIKPWDEIVLTVEEIKYFIDLLKKFNNDFLTSIKNKIDGIYC